MRVWPSWFGLVLLLLHVACQFGNAGKTYIGVQLVRLLLANTRSSSSHSGPEVISSTIPASLRPEIGPILVLCYTNHALDAFLLDLVECGIDEGIIRVGRRCVLVHESLHWRLFATRKQLHSRERYNRPLSQGPYCVELHCGRMTGVGVSEVASACQAQILKIIPSAMVAVLFCTRPLAHVPISLSEWTYC